jgi:type IV pilus assembly protein PilY1
MKKLSVWNRFSGAMLALVIVTLTPSVGGLSIVQAAATDVSPAPIFTSTTAATEVKPNIMLVLDDSGSMDSDFMPDATDSFSGKYGFASSQCNGVYYNPAITYEAPVDAAGLSYTNANFISAKMDGYVSTSTSTNLSSSFKSNSGDTAQAAYYYVYSGTQTTEKQKDYYNANGIFYKECNSDIGSTIKVDGINAVNTLFTKKTVSSTSGPGSTDERTNFANWYSFYRTRMLMMKTSSGLAFKTLNQHFRVGFMSINNNTGSDFLNISDFDSTQKTNWYDKLYSSTPNNSTPLRRALSNAGRLFAGQVTTLNGTTATDPVQYACQQNYTILSTDGFWNGNNGFQLNGTTAVGNQDGTLPRPYNDGTSATAVTVTPYTSTQDRSTQTTGIITTKTFGNTTTSIGGSCIVAAGTTIPPLGRVGVFLNIGGTTSTRVAALALSASNPETSLANASKCYSLGGQAWFCRGGNSSSVPVATANQSTVTGTDGKKWYLVTSGVNAAGCVTANTAFPTLGSRADRGVCPATVVAPVTGNTVTLTPDTRIETLSGAVTTVVDRYTAAQTTTQTTTDGVPGPLGALTPAAPVYSFTSQLSNTTTANTSDTFGPWTSGTATSSCVATASLPAAGTSASTLISTSSSSGTASSPAVVASSGPTAGAPTVTTTVNATGTSNMLADVAAYYYNTNLRTSALGNCAGPIISPATTPTNLCLVDKVPSNGVDTATWQHMTTFTLGLGARGRMIFSPTYLTDGSGDYFDVWKGNKKLTTNCTWADALTIAGGKCNWPVPGSDKIENIDDLWHAAVNGHGNYFSAADPKTLRDALASSLDVIINTPQPGTAASAATTNPKITATNNFQFSSYFKSVEWSGELIRQTINIVNGSVPAYDHTKPNPAAYDWSAQVQLDARSYTTRTIYTKGSAGLIPFTWTALGTAGLQSNFTTPNISTSPPSFPNQLTGLYQFCAVGTDCISASAQSNNTIATGGAAGEALVNFLRGDRSSEEGVVNDTTKYFRHRVSVLGDIVSAQPQFVGPPSKNYTDTGYTAFKTAQASRTALVYAAANDGMLHAFNASTGSEAWAYIPSFVLPRLYTLADKNYSDKHQYFVEGTPKSSDVYIGGAWKTILVGGMNAGGTGFYALDITDPANPSLLWEFTNNNMGYTFGNPEITKLDNGTWVVLLTSGYNNCPSSTTNCSKNSVGDGTGHLYVLDAQTGTLVSTTPSSDISTGVGTTIAPSGLSRIIAQAQSNNVTSRVYGGDLLGNLWRFTIGSTGYSKQLLATFKDVSGNPQPITSRPQVTTVNGNPIVYVGTGRYLGTTDVGSTLQQSFYAIKDNLGATSYGNPRTSTNFISKTAVIGTCPAGTSIDICAPNTKIRTVTQNNGIDNDSLRNKDGWYVDFPVGSGEISFTDSKLTKGTLSFSTSTPKATTSEVCGSSTSDDPVAFDYSLDYLTGGAIGSTGGTGVAVVVGNNGGIIAGYIGKGISTAPQIEQLPDGTVLAKYRLSDGQEVSRVVHFGSTGNSTKRISWRELIEE